MRTILPVSAWLCVCALLCVMGSIELIGYSPNSIAAQGASAERDKTANEYAATLPKDVYPDSGSRLPLIKREDLNEEDKKVFDLVLSDERSAPNTVVGLRGPPGLRLHSVGYAENARMGSRYLRFHSGLDRRLYELTVLVTAREFDQQYEWAAHEPAARKEGLEQAIIDIVKYRKPVTGIGEKEAAIIQLGREAIGKRKVSSDTFARALKLFGDEVLVNMVSLMGQYAGLTILLNTFDQQLPPGQKPPLPMP